MKTVKQSFLMFLFIPAINWVIHRRRETANTGVIEKLIAHLQNLLRNADDMSCISTIPRKRQRKIEASPRPKKEDKTKRKIQVSLMALASVTPSSTAPPSACGLP